MENLNTRQGAARMGRRSSKSPLELLQRLVDGDPNASRSRVLKNWLKEVRADDAYIEAVELYAFDNLWNSVTRKRDVVRRPTPSAEDKVALRKWREERIASIHEQVVEKVLTLSFVMPNGRSLADCSGTEVAKVGGIFAAIGKRAGKRLVREAFTDDQLRALAKQ
jgi:hypothetical protein